IMSPFVHPDAGGSKKPDDCRQLRHGSDKPRLTQAHAVADHKKDHRDLEGTCDPAGSVPKDASQKAAFPLAVKGPDGIIQGHELGLLLLQPGMPGEMMQ